MSTFINWSLIIFVINILLSFIVIMDRDKSSQSALTWLFVLYLLPGIGFFIYLFIGRNTRKAKAFRIKELEDASFDEFFENQKKEITDKNYSFEDWKSFFYNDLISMNIHMKESFYTEDNSVKAYNWGRELFEDIKEDIRNAKDSIEFQSYIYRPDELGMEIIELLTEKAKEGVEVRFLVDALGGRFIRKKHLQGLIDAGGQVGFFFPGFLKIFNFRVNYRNHRKIIVIDHEISYCGGFNVGNDYLGKYVDMGPWRDTHLRIYGDLSVALKIRFIKDWCFSTGEDIDNFHNKLYKAPEERRGDVAGQVITSGPDTKKPYIKDSFFKIINLAEEKILIQTPYFVLDESIMEALKVALYSGVEVHIMVPQKKDHPFVFWANLNNLGDLLKAGAKVYYYQPGFLHSKMIIMDDFISSVGSANFDNRSFYLNFECNVILYDYEMNEKLTEFFMEDIERSKEYTLEDYRNRSAWVQIKESFCRLLSPLL